MDLGTCRALPGTLRPTGTTLEGPFWGWVQLRPGGGRPEPAWRRDEVELSVVSEPGLAEHVGGEALHRRALLRPVVRLVCCVHARADRVEEMLG